MFQLFVGFVDGFPDKYCPLDMLWIDFGAGPRLGEFFDAWWPRLSSEGGLALVHSTLTNDLTRSGWLEGMRKQAQQQANVAAEGVFQADEEKDGNCHSKSPANALGKFATLSLMEPHKLFQNSFSIFQKRGDGWAEPVYTKFP